MKTARKKISTKTAYLQALRDMKAEKTTLQNAENILYVKLLKFAPETAVKFLTDFNPLILSI